MKSKQEILNNFYTTGADGLPEIAAADLLNAMEAYKQQSLEAAFTAARVLNNDAAPQPDYRFLTYTDYIKSTEVQIVAAKTDKHDLAESIALVADSILPNFLPDDLSENEFSFDFNMMGIGYTAFYNKDDEGYWKMKRWTVGR